MQAEPENATVGASRWPLVKVFDVVALVLVAVVVARAIGGVLSALGVPASHLNGARADLGIPTYVRIEYGTIWADLSAGILLLASLMLLALPRILGHVPPDYQGTNAGVKVILGVLIVAAVATAAGVVYVIDVAGHTNEIGPPTQALTIAQGVAAAGLSALVATLSLFALRSTSLLASPGQLPTVTARPLDTDNPRS